MKKVMQANEKFKKVSKNDIITFFKHLMNDKNVMDGEASITILSAAYKRIRKGETNNTKHLTIKFICSDTVYRQYFDFDLVRLKVGEIIKCSICRVRTIEESKTIDVEEKLYNGARIVKNLIDFVQILDGGKWAQEATKEEALNIQGKLLRKYGWKRDRLDKYFLRSGASTCSYSVHSKMIVLHVK